MDLMTIYRALYFLTPLLVMLSNSALAASLEIYAVQDTLESLPAANATVYLNGSVIGKTGKDGRYNATLPPSINNHLRLLSESGEEGNSLNVNLGLEEIKKCTLILKSTSIDVPTNLQISELNNGQLPKNFPGFSMIFKDPFRSGFQHKIYELGVIEIRSAKIDELNFDVTKLFRVKNETTIEATSLEELKRLFRQVGDEVIIFIRGAYGSEGRYSGELRFSLSKS